MLAPALLKPGRTLRFPAAGDLRFPAAGDLRFPAAGDLRFPAAGDLRFPAAGDLRFLSAGDFAVPSCGGSWALQAQLHGTAFTCVPRSRGHLPGPTRMGRGDGPPCCCFIHNLRLLEGRPLALGLAQHREPVARGKCLEELKASGVSAGPPGAHGAQSRVCSTAPTGS